MTMALTAWHNPLAMNEVPMVFRMLMICRVSRVTIMNVRRMLSGTEIEKYGRPKRMTSGSQMLLPG